jgi:hypothetical protein
MPTVRQEGRKRCQDHFQDNATPKRVLTPLFSLNWVHVKKRLKLKRSLKELRKLGATLLDGHPTYGRFASLFLGHSPRTVKDRHYAAPSQNLFDVGVAWLGRQLGQCD